MMIWKLCLHCGMECWHNSCTNKDRVEGRCTFCGHPPSGNVGTMKKEYSELVRARQTNRARILREKTERESG